VPAGADLVLRIAYKKIWTYEGLAVEDRSALGLYVWERTVPTIEAMALQPAAGAVADAGTLRFTHDLTREVELLAPRPNFMISGLVICTVELLAMTDEVQGRIILAYDSRVADVYVEGLYREDRTHHASRYLPVVAGAREDKRIRGSANAPADADD